MSVDAHTADVERWPARQQGRRELVLAALLLLCWVVGTALVTLAMMAAAGVSVAPVTDAADLAEEPASRERLLWSLGGQTLVTAALLVVIARFPPATRILPRAGDWRLIGIAYPAFFLVWTAFVLRVYVPLWTQFGLAAETQPQLELVQHSGPAGLVLLVTSIVFVAPVFEELLFRGYLFQGLLRLHGARAAIVWTSLVFGLMHGGFGFFPVLPLVLIGAFFGWLRLHSGGLFAPMLAHAIHNGLTIGLALVDSQWTT